MKLMKKALAIVFLLILTLLAGCGEKTPQTQAFTGSDMTIILPAGFESKDNLAEVYDSNAVYHSDDFDNMFICTFRDDFTSEIGLDELSLDDYISMCMGKDPTERTNVTTPEYDGLKCYRYEYIDGADTPTTRIIFVYKGANAFWRVEFSEATETYTSNEASYVEWARTVTVS